MRFTAAIVLGAAGLAAAQSSTSAAASVSSGSPSGCGSQIDTIIKACLASTQPIVEACSTNDWGCMCKAQESVVTCYNNCPSDPNAFGAKQQETSWCNAAKAYPDSSSSSGPTGTAATNGGAGATAASTTSKTAAMAHTGFASASGSASASATPDNAANGLAPAGGLVAAIFGLALL